MLDLITDPDKNIQEEIERKYTFSHYEVCGKTPKRLEDVLLNDNIHNLDVDEETRQFLLEKFRLKKDDIFLEIGTYYGFGTVKLSQNVRQVVGIEADKHNFYMTKRNVEKNCNNVTLVNKAVGKSTGKQVLYSRQRKIGQAKSLHRHLLKNKMEYSYEVEVNTIDNILIELKMISLITFISLEINLSEIDALLGAGKFLSESNNIRLLAAGWYQYNDKPASIEIKRILKGYNFKVFVGIKNRVYAYKD